MIDLFFPYLSFCLGSIVITLGDFNLSGLAVEVFSAALFLVFTVFVLSPLLGLTLWTSPFLM